MKELITPSYKLENIIGRGAEAKIYTTSVSGIKILAKERLPKTYRAPEIDSRLRKERTTQETRILLMASKQQLPVPRLIDVDTGTWTIYMEYLPYPQLKSCMDQVDIQTVFEIVGGTLANFHNLDIIHGDLTTSNMLWNGEDIYFIDFGLGFISTHIEDKAVDILVLKHTLESSHASYAEKAMEATLNAYQRGTANSSAVDRLDQIEHRVRYRSHGLE